MMQIYMGTDNGYSWRIYITQTCTYKSNQLKWFQVYEKCDSIGMFTRHVTWCKDILDMDVKIRWQCAFLRLAKNGWAQKDGEWRSQCLSGSVPYLEWFESPVISIERHGWLNFMGFECNIGLLNPRAWMGHLQCWANETPMISTVFF